MNDTAKDRDARDDHDHDHGDAPEQGGQVSEAANLRGDPEPVLPSDATAGHPTSEGGGGPQEGTAGPDAPPEDGRPSDPDK